MADILITPDDEDITPRLHDIPIEEEKPQSWDQLKAAWNPRSAVVNPRTAMVAGWQGKTPEELQRENAAQSGLLLKGAPIVGAAVPQTEDMTKFEQEHPAKAAAWKGAGAVMGTAPFAAAAPSLMGINAAAPWAARTAASIGSNATLNAADTAARGGTADDVKKAATIGAVTGGIPTLATRLFSPGLGPKTAEAIVEGAPPIAGGAYGLLTGGYEPGVFDLLVGEGVSRLAKPLAVPYLTNNVLTNALAKSPLYAAAPGARLGMAEALTRKATDQGQ